MSKMEEKTLSMKPPKIQLSTQAKKVLGNVYMKDFVKNLDKTKVKPKMTPAIMEE